MEGMKDQRYSRLDGRMNDQEYSHLGGSGEHWKYSRLVGMDGRLEILKFRWQGCKIDNTQGQVEGMGDKKYSRLVVRDER